MIFLDNRKIFISGGAGVIGTELVKRLDKRGADLFVGDLKPIPKDFPKNIIYRQGDLNYITEEEIQRFNPDIFFHLAATFERSIETYEHWEENFWHNIKLSNHLMTLIRNISSVKRVVFASSYLIYDKELYNFAGPQKKPVRLSENNHISPRNLTGMAKLAHEVELDFLSNFKSDQFTSISARIFRGYGKGSKDVISRWVKDALEGNEIEVYNQEGLFDYIYAEDTAEGLIRLSQIDEEGVVNLGTGRSRKIKDLVSVLNQNFSELKIKYNDSDLLYEASEADIDQLNALTGWRPEFDLEESIPKIIAYEKQISDIVLECPNVLILSISKKVPLIQSVKNSLNKINQTIQVFGGDANISCIGKYFVDEFWNMPIIEELSIDALVEFCDQKNIRIIIPTRDGELEYFSEIKDQLEKHKIVVLTSDKEAIKTCLDKLKFSKLEGINAVPTSENIEDLDADRFVVKERFGAGAKKIGINLTKEESLKHSDFLDHAIYQPYIVGQEISVDAYITRGNNVKGIVMRYRELIVDGESQITTTFQDVNLEKKIEKILKSLHLYGHVILQSIISNNGDFHVIECNPRFGGASTLSIAAGLDSFYWAYLESMGSKIVDYPFMRSQKDITQVRYPSDIHI